MRRLILFLSFLSTTALAHEAQLITQHIKLNRQNESAWQTDALARAVISTKFEAGLQASYVERFDLYEKRMGGFLTYRPTETITLEGRYLKGDQNVVLLPHDQYLLSLYHSLTPGLSPFLIYKATLYTITHLQSLNLGIEIEKFRNFIIIPQLTLGQAKFSEPSEVKNVYNYGLRIIYYQEGKFFASIFGYKGTEAAQGLIGESNRTIDTLSGGLGLGHYLTADFKAEILFDYLDLGALNNQFLTTTLNLVWSF